MATTDHPPLKARDIAPTGVRLPPALRDELMRQATINNRSLSQEITQRLQGSLDHQAALSTAKRKSMAREVSEERPVFGAQPASEAHRQITALFDALTPDKQLALLTLLKR